MPSYILREGVTPGVAIYTRCEDELLCRAELLLTLDSLGGGSVEQKVFGFYDVDPTFTIAEFKRAYKGRTADYKVLMAARSRIIKDGWPYPETQANDDAGS